MKNYRLDIEGLVQGIGFRPAVANISNKLGVKGFVENIGGRILIIVQTNDLNSFKNALYDIPNAKITSIKITEMDNFEFFPSFTIRQSEEGAPSILPPDIGICPECLNNLENPFSSCNVCGARYTTIEKLPYDRENTSLKDFPMCSSCQQKYQNFNTNYGYAQGLVCPDCGLKILYNDDAENPIEKAICDIKSGKVIAIKGIGGYHLACNPFNASVVKKLREIKGRETKPFAVVFKNIEKISKYCIVSELEYKWLLSNERPVVLLKMRKNYEKCGDENDGFIACGVTDFEQCGCFLPSTGLEQILLNELGCLVMTSANITNQPIIFDDEDVKKLNVPVLWFNRKIVRPVEDSVVRIIAEQPQIIRRAKGFVPLPLPLKTNKKILAMGGDLKACFAICDGENAFLSPYIGDLEEKKTFELFKKNLQEYCELFDFTPELIVCDLHPEYFSSQYSEKIAKKYNIKMIKVQHHKAHIAAVMAEYGLKECIGIAYDGTGYGEDGNIWGGEIFSVKNDNFVREWHYPYVKYLNKCEKDSQIITYCTNIESAPPIIRKALDNNVNTYLSSSVGRLFDQYGYENFGFRNNTYEGEIACKLEHSVKKNDIFLKSLSDNIDKNCNEISKKKGIKSIVLSGGCFQNKILVELVKEACKDFDVFINQKVPVNDGGICIGQAYIVRNL